jgi:predicted dienelactone hydrolase
MRRGSVLVCLAVLGFGVAGLAVAGTETTYPVGMKQVEFPDSRYGERVLTMAVFYPAKVDAAAKPMAVPFFKHLELYRDAELAPGGEKRPLVMFSHGRGSNPMQYSWFAQTLARNGYIVAAPYHWRANTYDATIAYLANKIWQRPVDIGLDIDFLLADPVWSEQIDPGRIGVAGHSQGGFTSLWLGGAKVNAEKYLAFQQGWRNNQSIPKHLREALPLDAKPALDVADPRIKAAFAMAPGVVKAFGMDADGLKQMRVPAYITVGAGDTQTPPKDNAEFAAEHIPGATLVVIPGAVDHEIFVNECDEEGMDEFPEACKDAPGVDRAAIHASVGKAALEFFGRTLRK